MLPRFAHQSAVAFEVALLQHLEHIHGVLLHLVEQAQARAAVEEHAPHDFCQNILGRARDARVVEQMAGALFGRHEERVGQPARHRRLVEAGFSLQELHAVQHAAELVLPAAARGEQLLENERAVAHGEFVPAQTAEVRERAEHRGGEDAAGAQARTGRDGGEQRDLDAAAEGLQALAQRAVRFGGKLREKTAERERGFGNGEGRTHFVELCQLFVGGDHLHRAEVDAAAHDVRLRGRLHIDLQGLLPVELNG